MYRATAPLSLMVTRRQPLPTILTSEMWWFAALPRSFALSLFKIREHPHSLLALQPLAAQTQATSPLPPIPVLLCPALGQPRSRLPLIRLAPEHALQQLL